MKTLAESNARFGRVARVLVLLLWAVLPVLGAQAAATNDTAAYIAELEARARAILESHARTNEPPLAPVADKKSNILPAGTALQTPPKGPEPVSSPSLGPASTNDLKAAYLFDMESLDDKHRLAIGDRLSFRILEDREDPKEPLEPKPLAVADSGELEVPYIGRVPAESKTCKQLAREIKAELEKEYYYQATVILAIDLRAKTRGRVYVVGPVRLPGPQELPSDETLTLSKAIMRAGGFNDYADRQHVKLTRKDGGGGADHKTLVVDVAQIFDKGKTELDVPLEPGDLIMVPERLIRF